LETELNAKLENIAAREVDLTNERSRVMMYFKSEHGLCDRARRAKRHIKRKYGANSPEYKMLTKKRY